MTRKRWTLLSLITALAVGCGGSAMQTEAHYGGGGESSADYAEAGGMDDAMPSSSTRAAEAAPMGGAADVAAAPPPSAPSRSEAPGMAGAATGGDGGGMAAPAVAPGESAARVSTTTTTTVTVTVDTPALPVAPEPVQAPVVQPERLLTAASVGDHDRRDNYLQYLQRHPGEAQRLGLDMRARTRFRVVDGQGQPVNDARLLLQTPGGTIEGRTHADGRWDYFRGVHGGGAGQATVTVEALNTRGAGQVHLPAYQDGQEVTIRLDAVRRQTTRVLDLAFLIDVTGSMEDELRYVNREVTDIVARVTREAPEVRVRVGAVFYRDRTDSVPLQRIGFTEDIQGFASAMQSVRASGGGDYPEDLDSGLMTALQGLAWSQGDAARVLVTIADAPPKRYQAQYTYRHAMLEASRRGIRLLPVAASGSNAEVEFLFRAMGTMTASPYVYLTDDSGIGNPHREADTDRVAVEYFNDLLTRVLVSDLQGQGMHEPAGFDR